MASGRKKRIIVDFLIGPMDGRRTDFDPADEEVAKGTSSFYNVLQRSVIGSILKTCRTDAVSLPRRTTRKNSASAGSTPEPTPGLIHTYELTERTEDDEKVAIRFEYRGCERQVITLSPRQPRRPRS